MREEYSTRSKLHEASLRPKRLTEAGGETVIVVVDFLPFSPTKRLSELLAEHCAGQTVYQIDPVTDLATHRAYATLDELTTAYSSVLLSEETFDRPVIIVSYCGAAPLASRIVAALGNVRDISLSLVRPTIPRTDMVAAEFTRFRTHLGAASAHAPEFGSPDHEALLQEMVAILDGDLKAMAAANDIDPSSGVLSELLGRYYGWLGFLLVSKGFTVASVCSVCPSRIILAAEEEFPTELIPAGVAVSRLDVPVDQFANSKLVATEILGAPRSNDRG